jgi:endonuclease YncB( thermonuclease family)
MATADSTLARAIRACRHRAGRRPLLWRGVLLALVVALLAPTCSLAQQTRPLAADGTCALEPGPARTVSRAIDAETFVFDDATEVRLIGALAPRAADGAASTGQWPPENVAKAALEELVLGRTVEIGFSGRRTDRNGRLLGQAFLHTDAAPVWVQGRMLELGHARAYSLPESTSCMGELIAHERAGRNAGRGLWAFAAYSIRAAERTQDLLRQRATYQIVEGRVASVADQRGRVFINFGPDYRQDFTIGLRPPMTRRMQESGIDPQSLDGRLVRVRGWIESRGGPFIELHHFQQIEVLPEAAALVTPSRRAARRRARPSAEPQ